MKKPSVFIVDDSAVARQVLTQILNNADLEVIGSAIDPIFALQKMEQRWPDVVVLDVEMPRMDGLTFLRKLMAERPTPVVICSTLSEAGAQTTLEAMAAGAVGFYCKARLGLKAQLETMAEPLIQAVKAAAHVNLSRLRSVRPRQPVTRIERSMISTTEKIVAIGTSTGGTQALEVVLTALPAQCPGIVVVQHMPEKFTAAFASRLNNLCQIEVKEAEDNDRVLPGRALIAPGGRHMELRRNGAQYIVHIQDELPVNRHRPSVDVLFDSVARNAGKNALGVIMTGMGDDGARGMLAMHTQGAYTLAEDESTCVVHGMPKEAVRMGGVDRELPLGEIADSIVAYASGFARAQLPSSH